MADKAHAKTDQKLEELEKRLDETGMYVMRGNEIMLQAHNDELPGSAKNSYHVKGKAMDFCVRGVSGAKLLAYVKTLPIHYAYQIGNSDFVHMDVT